MPGFRRKKWELRSQSSQSGLADEEKRPPAWLPERCKRTQGRRRTRVMMETWSIPYQQGEPFYGRSNWTDRSTTVRPEQGENRAGTVAARPPLFSGISPEDYTRIAAAARVKEFARGEMLYIGGDSVSQVLLLTSGFAKISQFGLSGAEVILRLSVPGDVLGAMGLFTTGLHFTTAQAFRMCRALVWDAPTFKALETRYRVLHENMVKILSEDLLELQERFRRSEERRVGKECRSRWSPYH